MDKTHKINSDSDDKTAKQSFKRSLQSERTVFNKKKKLNDTGLHKRSLNIFKSEAKRNMTFANDRLKRLRNQICSEVVPFSTTSSILKNNIFSNLHTQRNEILPSRRENKRNYSPTSSNLSNLPEETCTLHNSSYLIKKSSLKSQKLNIPSYNTNEDHTCYRSFDKDDKLTERDLQHTSELQDQLQFEVQATISKNDHTMLSSPRDNTCKLSQKKLPINVSHRARKEENIFSSEKGPRIVNFQKKEDYKKLDISLKNNKDKNTEITVETRESSSRSISFMKLSGRTVGCQSGSLNISIANSISGTKNSEIKIPDLSDNLEIENKHSRYSPNKMSNFEYTIEPKSPEKFHHNQELKKTLANSRLLKLRSDINDDKKRKDITTGTPNENSVSYVSKTYSYPKSAFCKFGKMASSVQEKVRGNRFSGVQMVNNRCNSTRVTIARPSKKSSSNLSTECITIDSMTDNITKCDKTTNKTQANHSSIVYKNEKPLEGSFKYWINYGQIIDSLYEKFFVPEKDENNKSFFHNKNLSEAGESTGQVNQPNFAYDEDAIMDWDDGGVIDEFTKSSSRSEQNILKQELYIVVDTNIFLSDLDVLKEVVTCGSSGRTKPILYVPWMVLTELDFMKDDKSTASHLKKKVTDAVAFINKTLLEKGRKLIGQNIFEAEQQKCIGKAPDDKILSCCMQAKQRNLNVILLSNDINLKNKLLIHEIPALSSTEMFKNPLFFTSNHKSSVENEIHKKLQKINEKMSTCCSYIICECTKYAYGEVWNKMDMLKNPPWTLKVCLQIFKKYWSSVFAERLLKHCLKAVEQLDAILKALELSRNTNTFQKFVQDCLSLCIFLKDIEEHKDLVEHIIRDISSITSSQ